MQAILVLQKGAYLGQKVGTMFAVMRSPVLMEDEGRHEFVQLFTSKAGAQEWIAAQKDEYFKPGDYYILEESH